MYGSGSQVLWEAKRTVRWNSDWLVKVGGIDRVSRTDVTVIFSVGLPECVRGFEILGGAYGCNCAVAKFPAIALRCTYRTWKSPVSFG